MYYNTIGYSTLKTFCIWLFLCGVATQLSGQRRPIQQDTLPGGIADSIKVASIDSIEGNTGPDTTIYDIFNFADPYVISPFIKDDLKTTSQYDPNEKWSDVTLYLGNIGGSTRNFFGQRFSGIRQHFGFDEVYSPYFITRENFDLMQINRPFSQVYFSPFQGQENFIAKAKLSQNIGEKSNVTIQFQRFLQEIYYRRQAVKTSSIGSSYLINGKKEKYKIILSYFGRFSDEEHSGGLRDTIGLYNSPAKSAESVNINDANTRFHDYSFYIDQHYRLGKDTNAIHFHHTIGYSLGLFKFGDRGVSASADSTVYKTFLVESAGLRNYQKFNHFNTQLNVHTTLFKLFQFSGFVGYDRQQITYNNIVYDRTFDQFHLGGKAGFSLKDNLSLVADLSSSTINGELYGKAGISALIAFKDWIRLDGELYRQSTPAPVNMQTLVINDSIVYDNRFIPIKDSGLSASLKSSKTRTSAQVRIGILEDAVYFGNDGVSQQSLGSNSYIQATIGQDFKLGIFGLDNVLSFQSYDDNIWNVPQYYTQHDLYIQDTLFENRLEYRFGFYLRRMVSNRRLAYQPINQAFYGIEGEGYIYPRFDTYVVLGIDQFQIFFRYENYYAFLNRDFDMQVFGFPHFDNRFRLGVKWLLKD